MVSWFSPVSGPPYWRDARSVHGPERARVTRGEKPGCGLSSAGDEPSIGLTVLGFPLALAVATGLVVARHRRWLRRGPDSSRR